jgi:uncharacterized FlaG/YvyC family protein
MKSMKIKVVYDTGTVVVDIPEDEVIALVARKERENDAVGLVATEKARQKRKVISVEVVA